MTMTKQELLVALKSNLFADRGTDLGLALNYANEMARASDNPMAFYTALQVVMNTVANIIEEQYEQVK
jgi:hypothetical protein